MTIYGPRRFCSRRGRAPIVNRRRWTHVRTGDFLDEGMACDTYLARAGAAR